MTLDDDLKILTAISNVAILATFLVYYFQLKAMRQQLKKGEDLARGQNFFTLIHFLQDPAIREARQVVLETLGGKLQKDWSDDDKKKASLVCSSYDAAVIGFKKQLVDHEIFVDNYGPSIKACYRTLKAFVQERQGVRGKDYWNDFQELGESLLSK